MKSQPRPHKIARGNVVEEITRQILRTYFPEGCKYLAEKCNWCQHYKAVKAKVDALMRSFEKR